MKTQQLLAGILAIFVLSGNALGQESGWREDGSVVHLRESTDNVGIGTSSPYAKLFVWQPSAFDTDYDSQIDNVCVSRVAATGLNAVGGSIGFTRVYGTPTARRAAAIAAVITHADYDACTGLAFYVHPSGSSSQPIVEGMRLTHGSYLGIGVKNPLGVVHSLLSTAFSTAYNDYVDNIYVSREYATGLNAVIGSIGFSRGYSTLSYGARRGAAIAAVITHPDYDACTGLAFYVHPSGSSSQPIVEHMRLTHGGNLGIGTTTVPSGYKLAVDGKIIAEEVQVEMSGSWPDHVFADDYPLMPLHEVAAYIKAHRHLPDMPSASEVAENGVSLGDMQARLLQKVEELTLYVIDLEKENEALKERVAVVEKQ